MAWAYLFIAALLEITWATGMKYTNGLTVLWPSVGVVLAFSASMYLLAQAARDIPIGTAYAVWAGIGCVGTAILGILLFKEPKDALRIVFITMIVIGIVGLKFFSNKTA